MKNLFSGLRDEHFYNATNFDTEKIIIKCDDIISKAILIEINETNKELDNKYYV